LTLLLADLVRVAHTGYVVFVVCAPFLLLGGALLARPALHARWLRRLHLATLAFIAFQWAFDWACPLTLLENRLRGLSEPTTFLGVAAVHAARPLLLPTVAASYLAFSLVAHHFARRASHGA
jgi:hypothetical protein